MRTAKGRYKEKHASDSPADPEIALAVNEKIVNGMITCTDAAIIASKLNKSLQEIGVVLDLLEVSLGKCQLGLFGYEPQKKIVTVALSVSEELETAIAGKLANGKLSCNAAWKIADALAVPKMNVSSACETMNIKIKPCQLGAF